MLIFAFLSLLVFSTYFSPLLINRISFILLIFILFIFYSSFSLLSINNGLSIYNDWFFINTSNIYFIFLILLSIILLYIYNIFYISNNINNDVHNNNIFYSLVILANLIGLILFPLVNDILSLYVLIELQSYSLYILTGLNNKSYNSSKAALLYFLMGGIASSLILLSSYYIYYITGTTNLQEIWSINYYTDIWLFNYILIIALLFKMGLAPLHKWSISVYNYAPTYITAYISIVAKISIISFIFTWITQLSMNYISTNNNIFTLDISIMYIFFISSLIIGAYKPLYQINIKTILAYSGLLNFSYLLLSLIINNELSDIAFYLYLSQYVITHILIFIIILTASYYINNDKLNNNYSKWSPITLIHQLNIPNKGLSGCLIIALFSLIGLPPLPGFYAKLLIFTSALSANYIFESLLIIIFSVIATYYYANIIKILMKNSVAYPNNISPILAYIISMISMLLLLVWVYLDIILKGLYLLII